MQPLFLSCFPQVYINSSGFPTQRAYLRCWPNWQKITPIFLTYIIPCIIISYNAAFFLLFSGAGNIRADYYPFRVFDEAESTITLINLCIVIIAILYTLFILKRIITQKKEFFMSILNILDLGQLVCAYAAIGFYTMRFIQTTKAIDVVVNSKGKRNK